MNSIKRKIILALVLIVACGFIIFEFYDFNTSQAVALAELEELSSRKADRLAESLDLPVWEIDNSWVERTIETEMADKRVYAVFVYAGEALFEGKERGGNWQPVKSANQISGDYIVRNRSIMHDGELTGSVKLYISQQFMQEELYDELIREIVSLSLLALLVVLTLIALLNRIVVMRLQHILKATKAIAAGDYSYNLDISLNDEIGMLGDGIHTMKGQIQQREQALKESEARFKRLAKQIPVPIAYVSKTGEFEFFNDRFSETFGYSYEDLPTIEQWWELAYPDVSYRQSVIATWEAASRKAVERKEDIEPIEYHVTCKNGDERIVEISGVFLGEDLLATCVDLTDRKQAEEKVRRYSQAMEQSGEAIVITDDLGVIEHINPAFTEVTGYSENEVVGKQASLLKSVSQDARSFDKMWKVISQGKTWQGKVINRKKSDELYPAMLTISPIKNDDGQTTHYIGIQQNLEKFEELETQFHQSQKMEAIGTLVGGIAHDFNNTLAGITGNLYLAKKAAKVLPDVVRRLDSVEQLSFSAATMIQQLLAFSRKGIVQMSPVSLATFLKETIKLQKVSLPENVDLQLQIIDADLKVKGDINQLQQVLMNLVNNAYDAVQQRKSPSIRIRLERFHADAAFSEQFEDIEEGEYASISVVDNGEGIHHDDLERVFEPFFTTKEPGRGTGLGLAMVYGAVKTHGGLIDVISSTDEPAGTTFRLYFPLLEAGEPISFIEVDDEIIAGKGETILLVDDNLTVLETGRDVLEGLGYKVITAEDGLQAIELYQAHQHEIGLLILDVVMPRLGGPDALKAIREMNPEVKAIFATGYDKLSTLGASKSKIAEKVISKPFAVSKLSQTIREVIEQA